MSLKVYYHDKSLQLVSSLDLYFGDPAQDLVSGLSDGGLDRALQILDDGADQVWILDPEPKLWLSQMAESCLVWEAAGGLVRDHRGYELWIWRHGRWDLPKGKREPGEELEDTAIREVEEETGIRAEISNPQPTCSYHLYQLDGQRILKRTSWFAMLAHGNQIPVPQTEEGILDIRWVPPGERVDYLKQSYPNIRYILGEDGELGPPTAPFSSIST